MLGCASPLNETQREPFQLQNERPVADRPARPATLADVARRISSRTTDLLAVSIVLVASLTLGRQILHWWHTEPPAPAAAAAPEIAGPAWDDPSQPLSLEFGDLPQALTRQLIKGDQDVAVEALVRHCQAAAETASRPNHEPDDAERRLLEKLAGLTPVEESSEKRGNGSAVDAAGGWQVYVIDERFTMVAAVRRFVDDGAADRSNETARSGVRLVCWGIAMPVGERAWTLYLFHESRAGASSSGSLPDVPLPDGARRNLSLRDEKGGALIGFSGRGSAKTWMTFYDDWFSRQGWSQTYQWSVGAAAWSASYRRPRESETGRVEIRFAADERGELTGLIQIN